MHFYEDKISAVITSVVMLFVASSSLCIHVCAADVDTPPDMERMMNGRPGLGGAHLSESTPEEKFKESVSEVYKEERTITKRGIDILTPFYGFYGRRLPSSINKGGKMSSAKYGAGASWTHVSGEESLITLLNLDYRRTDYGWSNGAMEPFNHVDSMSLFFWQEWVFDRSQGRSVAGFGATGFTADDTTDFSAGTRGTFGVGLKQYFSKTESVWLGLVASYSRNRERWIALPFIFANWSPVKNINLRFGNGITATWDVDGKEEWLLNLGISYETDAIAVGRGDIWRGQSVPIIASATWNFSKNFFVGAGVNTVLWSDYRNWRGGHEKDEHFTVDTSVEISIQAGLRF